MYLACRRLWLATITFDRWNSYTPLAIGSSRLRGSARLSNLQARAASRRMARGRVNSLPVGAGAGGQAFTSPMPWRPMQKDQRPKMTVAQCFCGIIIGITMLPPWSRRQSDRRRRQPTTHSHSFPEAGRHVMQASQREGSARLQEGAGVHQAAMIMECT